ATRASTFDTDGHGIRRTGSAWNEIASGLATATVDQASTLPIVEAICAMAHKLGKQVVAEGVETAYQRDYLRRLGVDLAQGYFFARPMKPADAESLLRRVTRETETSRRLQANLPAAVETPLFDEIAAGLTPNREFDELLLHD
ncbi:MAG TPA: EAL domain-containing protein, partial [Trueperaceae bacterium]|nr:EAL domain-containing protein [Trueperaceae bacterium]